MPAQNPSTLKKSSPEVNPSEVTVVPTPAKDLLVWQAPARPFKKRGREYFSTIAAIVFLLIIILLFIKEWLLIGVIIALTFVSYVLATIPPEEITHKITTRGLTTGGKSYKWDWFSRFWFSKKWNNDILHLETILVFPRRLQLLLKEGAKEEVKKIIEKYLLFEKPKRTMVDKAAKWLQEKVPLESQSLL
jgi:hypothetical protein